jgi:hypothetical protein
VFESARPGVFTNYWCADLCDIGHLDDESALEVVASKVSHERTTGGCAYVTRKHCVDSVPHVLGEQLGAGWSLRRNDGTEIAIGAAVVSASGRAANNAVEVVLFFAHKLGGSAAGGELA